MLNKIIRKNEKVDQPYIFGGSVFILMGVVALISGVAINIGFYGSNSQIVSKTEELSSYLYLVKAQFLLGALMIIRGFVHCPLFFMAWSKASNFKNNHKFLYGLVMFLGIPVLVVILIVLLMMIFG